MFNRSHPVVSMQNDLRVAQHWMLEALLNWMLEAVCAIILSLSYSNFAISPNEMPPMLSVHVVHGIDTFSLSLIPLQRECSSRISSIAHCFPILFDLLYLGSRISTKEKRIVQLFKYFFFLLFSFCAMSPELHKVFWESMFDNIFHFKSLQQILFAAFNCEGNKKKKRVISIKSML